MGTRSQREAGRGTIISDPVTRSGRDTQPCGHPSASQTSRHSPCSAAPFLSQRQAPSPLHTQFTHSHIHTYILTQIHTISHTTQTLLTHPHTPLIHSSHTAHTHSLHTLTHTNTLTPHTHIHTHTLLTHTHSSYPHTHTHPHTLLTCTHTHTHTHTHKHRAYRSTDTGNTGTQGQCSHTRHVERVGTAQSPRWGQFLDLPHTGSHWDS